MNLKREHEIIPGNPSKPHDSSGLDSGESSSAVTFILGGLTGGGSERVASRLITWWTEQGREVTLITLHGSEKDFFKVPDRVERIVLGSPKASPNKWIGLSRNFLKVWKIRKAVRRADTPVVISFLTRMNIYTILACMGLNKKVVISERNDTTRQHHGWPWHGLRERIYRYASVVTANSEIALKDMARYVPQEKLHLVPNAVGIPNRLAEPAHSRAIIHAGRLVPAKGQDLLIEAFTGLDDSWSLELLGEGPERERLQGMIRDRNLTERVTLHGLVDDPNLWYRRGGIFVLPSRFEGTPNVLLEAMAHGLPVVVSDSLPGALELVEDGVTGLVFHGGNPADLREKLEILISDPDLRNRLGAAARKRTEQFSIDRVGAIWNHVISS